MYCASGRGLARLTGSSQLVGVALTQGQVVRGLGDKPALLWENAANATACLTYAQLDALTNRLASGLRRLGVGPGDRVFLRLPNRPEFYPCALQKRLPKFRLPMAADDRDTIVDLHATFVRSFDQGSFSDHIDYSREPATTLQPANQQWLDSVLKQQKLRA